MNFGDDYIEVNPYKYDAEMPKEPPKYRLIDILNKIANGELKEGTRVIWDFKEYIYDGQHELWRNQGRCHYDILEEICLGNLSEEVELIESNR